MHHQYGKHDRSISAARTSRLPLLRTATSLAMVSLLAMACSDDGPGSTGPGGVGGASSTGGSNAGTGGASITTGGASSSSTGGGNTGGAATGGSSSSATGGAATGGTSAAPGSTGGASAGGKSSTSTGGAATGGAGTGGKSATSTGGGTAGGGKSSTSTGGAFTGGSSTGGAETGGAASGGAATGGSNSSPVTPTKVSASDYQFVIGDVGLHVNPQIGARVSKLTIGTTNIIQPYTCASYVAGSDCDKSAGGTFWTSPQSAWDGVPGGDNVWPPVAAVDGNAYTPTITDDHLVLAGAADSALGASVTKDFSADAGTGWISIKYTIKATKQIQVAPWQINRVPRGGLVFFPLVSLISNSTSWTLTPQGGYEWLDDKNQTSVTSSGPKVIADGGVSGETMTWLAYALNGNLFLMRFPDVNSTSFAPNESDTQVYPGSGYLELEAQGPYKTLASGGTHEWTVEWLVVPLPSSVTVATNSATLLEFVQQKLGT